jgi:REP element-mobilizing transposase RayT
VPSVKVSQNLNAYPHFITMTVQRWYYLFDRHNRWQILFDSLHHCQQYKQLKVYHWVFMLNHIHLIVASPDVSGFIRDFKRHTTKELKQNIISTEPNIIELFQDDTGRCNIWQRANTPKAIESDYFYQQKANYIEHNPVRKTYVDRPEQWRWSSAHPSRFITLDDILVG